MQELFTRKFYATDISSSWEAAPPVNGNDIKRPLLRVDMHKPSKRQRF